MSKQTHWAVDLGTTNTLIARWSGTHAETVALDRICQYEPAWQTPLVPSAIFFESPTSGYIGHRAIAAEEVMRSTYSGHLTPIARAFKKTLAKSSSQAVAELDHQPISARQCAKVFMTELLRETAAREQELNSNHINKWNIPRRFVAWARREGLVNDLTMTVPVESFEAYRMELNNIARGLGVQRFKVIDEPVAAALGYGVDLTEDRHLLVVDFGGGTLDIALVKTNLAQAGEKQKGTGHRRAELIAARGLNLGGETVDEWVTELACSKIKTHADRMFGYIRAQAETVKKELSGKVLTTDQTYFRLPGLDPLMVSRQEFLDALTGHELYTLLQRVTEATLEDAQHRVNIHEIDAVLLVGGSTLLPGVRELYEKMFGAPRVHYWEPFEAVVKGAAIYGAGYFVDQIIHHDYAIKVFNDEKQCTDYELLIRRGTPYPTPSGSQSRYYAVAQGQQFFSVPVCEVGYAGRLSLGWQRRGNGNDYWTPQQGEEAECVVSLNEGDSIQLKLPGQPGNRARLRIDFHIDEERHLVASMYDIQREREIRNERVTRLR
ncbi:MAG: Hsp70 family protein [Chthonomonadales bacterium]